MEGIEIEARTINEAIEKACDEFQVPREKLNIEIIAEGNSGFLGLGAKKALIRARLLTFDMTLDDIFPEKEKEIPVPAEMKKPAETAPESVEAGTNSGGNKPRQQPLGKKGRPSDSSVSVKSEAKPKTPEVRVPEPLREKEAEKPQPTTAVAPDGEPAAQKAKRIIEGILSRMQFPSVVAVEETADAIVLSVEGDGSGLLIGKRGQNLDALQYVVNKAVNHTANGNKMIVIDTEEYRKRREESLVALAAKIAEKVRKTRKPVTVGHMNAHDRRIIHMAIQNDEILTTKSRGEGEYRKVVILPAKRGQGKADT
jgi:spoIIIJ-associated protein